MDAGTWWRRLRRVPTLVVDAGLAVALGVAVAVAISVALQEQTTEAKSSYPRDRAELAVVAHGDSLPRRHGPA
jgi:hypothetical protein